MPRRRRNVEAFSLSFLDCICCGFGAIILLLVLSKIYEPMIIEKTQDDLESLIALLQQELFDIRGETTVLNRELDDVRQQTSESKLRLARLQRRVSAVAEVEGRRETDAVSPLRAVEELPDVRRELRLDVENRLVDEADGKLRLRGLAVRVRRATGGSHRVAWLVPANF